eukprot:scaffold5475_cov164-Skeletonema_dohrnii-CCMP3373.AAC.2
MTARLQWEGIYVACTSDGAMEQCCYLREANAHPSLLRRFTETTKCNKGSTMALSRRSGPQSDRHCGFWLLKKELVNRADGRSYLAIFSDQDSLRFIPCVICHTDTTTVLLHSQSRNVLRRHSTVGEERER